MTPIRDEFLSEEELSGIMTGLASREKETRSLSRLRDELRGDLSGHEVALAAAGEKKRSLEEAGGRLQEETARLDKRIDELKVLREDLEARITQGDETAAAEKKLTEDLAGERDSLSEEVDRHQKAHRELSSELEEAGNRLKALRREWEETSGGLSAVSVDMAELKTRAEEIRNRALSETDVDLRGEWPEELKELLEGPAEELAERCHRLKTRVSRIGPVNMAALEEIDGLQERLTFLTDQKKDLEEALESLSRAITKINRSSRERFSRTFEAVGEKFTQIYKTLFNGGDAVMTLEEDADLLEAGVQIYARPPGKKRTRLSLLSGGEKAMTALALLFALFAVRPSPFCLMDEVDAPLDDVNIDRFIKLVDTAVDDSQMVLITHNKRTMEMASNLVGVTMESPGISKLISVSLNDSRN